jgi:hypothetical protein
LVYIQDTLYLTVQGWSLHLRVMVEASESMDVRGGGVRSVEDIHGHAMLLFQYSTLILYILANFEPHSNDSL